MLVGGEEGRVENRERGRGSGGVLIIPGRELAVMGIASVVWQTLSEERRFRKNKVDGFVY